MQNQINLSQNIAHLWMQITKYYLIIFKKVGVMIHLFIWHFSHWYLISLNSQIQIFSKSDPVTFVLLWWHKGKQNRKKGNEWPSCKDRRMERQKTNRFKEVSKPQKYPPTFYYWFYSNFPATPDCYEQSLNLNQSLNHELEKLVEYSKDRGLIYRLSKKRHSLYLQRP